MIISNQTLQERTREARLFNIAADIVMHGLAIKSGTRTLEVLERFVPKGQFALVNKFLGMSIEGVFKEIAQDGEHYLEMYGNLSFGKLNV